jgi:hypothetical protein
MAVTKTQRDHTAKATIVPCAVTAPTASSMPRFSNHFAARRNDNTVLKKAMMKHLT